MVVKKYGNRRLYDTEASSYITLEELAERIRQGDDVQVIDARTGGDLTQATLAQVILESRGAARLLPVPLLKQLIRMGDDALAEFFGRYVAWALEVYLHARQGAQAILPWTPLSSAPFTLLGPLSRLFGAAPWVDPAAPRSPSGAPDAAPTDDVAPEEPPPAAPQEELAALRRELEELKRKVEGKRRR
jgi:polyhydroxyalkanoate synthesis repressor PhaR